MAIRRSATIWAGVTLAHFRGLHFTSIRRPGDRGGREVEEAGEVAEAGKDTEAGDVAEASEDAEAGGNAEAGGDAEGVDGLAQKICPDNVLADLEPAGDVVADVAVPLGDFVHRCIWILCLSCER